MGVGVGGGQDKCRVTGGRMESKLGHIREDHGNQTVTKEIQLNTDRAGLRQSTWCSFLRRRLSPLPQSRVCFCHWVSTSIASEKNAPRLHLNCYSLHLLRNVTGLGFRKMVYEVTNLFYRWQKANDFELSEYWNWGRKHQWQFYTVQ